MANETLEEKKLEAEAPAEVEDGANDSEKKTASIAVSDEAKKEKEEPKDEIEEEEKDEAKEEEVDEDGGENEEGRTGKKRSERKKSAEKEPVTPVSDRPTRERKKVERYSLPTPRSSATKSVSIEKGRGTMLREIPNVAYKLSKRKPDDNLLILHTILYGKKAKPQMMKKNIGQFSGFVWPEKEEEKQRARVKDKIEKCIKEKLIDFCDVLDIPINKSNVKKEELSVKILEFLEYPKATRDILLVDREKPVKKRKVIPKNENSVDATEVVPKKKRQSGNKRNHPAEAEEGKDEGNHDLEGVDDPLENNTAKPNEESEDKGSQIEKTSPEKRKSSSEKTNKESFETKKDKAASTTMDTHQITKPTPSSIKKQKLGKEASKPQAKSKDQGKRKRGEKDNTEPTREEMHAVVTKILREVDFNTATLSDILRKLGIHFGVDLMNRKTEVRDIITDAINEMTDDEDEEDGEEEDGEKSH